MKKGGYRIGGRVLGLIATLAVCACALSTPCVALAEAEADEAEVIPALELESEDPMKEPLRPTTYDITLMGNGGLTPSGAPTITLEGLMDGCTYELPESPFERDGYEFVGWAHTEHLEDDAEPLQDGAWFDGSASDQFGGTGRYWAQWQPVDGTSTVLDAAFGDGMDLTKRIKLAQRLLKSIAPGATVEVQYVREVDFGFHGWTNERHVNCGDNTGECFCVNNGLRGSHNTFTATTSAVPGNVDGAKAALWFGYNGPGQAEGNAFWPATDYNGSAISEADRIGYTHIILNYFVRGELDPSNNASPYANMTAAERNWVKANLTSGPNTTAQKMLAAKDQVSPQFNILLINRNQSDYQDLVGWAARGFGDIRLTKQSAKPSVTSGNPDYSLEGALYSVFASDGVSPTDTYIKTDANGCGYLFRWGTDATRTKLEVGTYTIKEYSASRGYALDTTSHTINVTNGGVATVTSTEPLRYGDLKLTKTSTAPSVTSGNPCYSLAGASYDVYSDSACTARVGTLVTNANGSSGTIRLLAGNYWVKEASASKGYQLDTKSYRTQVMGGETITLSMKESPYIDEVRALVRKTDAATGRPNPQGDASLADAQFTVDFYAGHYDSLGDLPSSPTRRWVFKTDAAGEAYFSSDYLVSGDNFYLSADNRPILPLGTVRIRETSAPTGYLVAKGADSLQQIDQNGTIPHTGSCIAALAISEQVVRGGVIVRKTAQDGTPLADAKFDIANASAEPVVVGGTSYAPGEVCATITSNANGIAKTGQNALPYGSYTITEREAPRGYMTNSQWSTRAIITGDADMVDLTSDPCVNERVTIQVPLESSKRFDGASQERDLETGMFTFALLDENGNVLQEKTNDASGKVLFDGITYDFRDLGDHTYRIAERKDTDEEIVYDKHTETLVVTIEAPDDHTLSYQIGTDDDGIGFQNETVPRIGLPQTGGRGVKGATAGSLLALAAAVVMRHLRRRAL